MEFRITYWMRRLEMEDAQRWLLDKAIKSLELLSGNEIEGQVKALNDEDEGYFFIRFEDDSRLSNLEEFLQGFLNILSTENLNFKVEML